MHTTIAPMLQRLFCFVRRWSQIGVIALSPSTSNYKNSIIYSYPALLHQLAMRYFWSLEGLQKDIKVSLAMGLEFGFKLKATTVILAVIAILFFDKLNTAFSIDAVYVTFLVARYLCTLINAAIHN